MNKSTMDARVQKAEDTRRYVKYPITAILEAIYADGFGQHTPSSCRGRFMEAVLRLSCSGGRQWEGRLALQSINSTYNKSEGG